MTKSKNMELSTTPSFRLDNKTALVTVASSVIGAAIATALATAGASVTIAARRKEKCDELCNELKKQNLNATAKELDVTNLNAVDDLINSSPPFEILINCAGLARHKFAVEETEEDFNAVMEVNTKAAYFVSQKVAKKLIAEKLSGSIITVSSQMGVIGGLKRSSYCASKHAVEGFTKALAWEWGEYGIRVNSICPTFIRTDLTEAALSEPGFEQSVLDKIALRRLGRVEDIMGVAVFLASDASGLITGSSLLVDGGWTAV